MQMPIRSSVKLAVAAVGVTCTTAAATVTPVADVWTAHRSTNAVVECVSPSLSSGPRSLSLTAHDIELVAAVSALLDDSAAPTIAPTPSLIALANAIDDIYVAVEEWVRYGFEVASDIVAWVPWVGIFANQIMVVYNFVESLINSGVFNTTDWLRGQGTVLKNVADWVVDLGLAVVWLGIDEIGAWIPLPPLDIYPPRPPAADLPEGFLGDAIVGASHLLADVSHGIWNIWEPIKGGVDWGVGAASDFLDAFAWVPFVPLINLELTAGWDLIAGEIDALTGFAHDMIEAGDQFVADTIQGDGLIAAIVNAFDNTVASIVTRSGQAWQAFTDWVQAQVDFFFNPAAQEDETTTVMLGTTDSEESPQDAETAEGDGTVSSVDVERPAEQTAGPLGSEIASLGGESEQDPEADVAAAEDESDSEGLDAGEQVDGAASVDNDDDDVVNDEDDLPAEEESDTDDTGSDAEPADETAGPESVDEGGAQQHAEAG